MVARTICIALILAGLVPAAVASQAIDRPAATVRLHKTDVIGVRELRTQIELLESRTGQQVPVQDRLRILDGLVGERLFDQAAERDRVSVNDNDVDTHIGQLRDQEGHRLNLGRALTDAEFRSLVGETGLSWDEYRELLRKALIQQRYVARVRGDELRAVELPTAADVEAFYDANKTTVFVQPDMVHFKHIFFDTRNVTEASARLAVRERAERVHRELVNGAQFDQLVRTYSDDAESHESGGLFGVYLRRDDQEISQRLGREFFDAPFAMAEGATSGVLRSNVGFHIVRVVDKVSARILGLDDPVNPMSESTVRDQIRVLLANSVQAQAYQDALLATLDDLLEAAEVRIFADNLRW